MADFRYDVFLSHSAKDKAVVRPLAERLRKDGVRVWFDEWVIKPGDNIPATIEDGLEHSRVLVLCMSAHAFGSDWAQLEAGTFRFRDPLNKERRFIPLRLDNAPIKGSLGQFLFVKWQIETREQEYMKLLEACEPLAINQISGQDEVREQLLLELLFLGHRGSVWSLAWSPDGRQALSGAEDRTILLWDVASGRCLRVLEGHTDDIFSVAWSPDGRQALSGGRDKAVRLWEVASGRCLCVLEGHTDGIFSVAWSPDGRQALSGGRDKTVRLWDVASGRCLRVLAGHSGSVRSVAWSPDGQQALSGGLDGTVRLWDVASGRCLRVLAGHSGSVRSVAWSPDGQQALSGGRDKTVRLWDVASGRCLRILEGHSGSVRSVAWSPDGQQALSGAWDKTVRLWDVASGSCLSIFAGHSGSVSSVAWSPDGEQALSGGGDTTIRLWDISAGRCPHVLAGHSDSVSSVAWSPDAQQALSGGDWDKTVLLWDVASGRCLRVLAGHTDGVSSVAWSPDAQQALSGGRDKTVRLWDVASGRCLRILEGHTDGVFSVAWSPDGRQALSGGLDGTIRLWGEASRRCLRVLEGHTDGVFSVAWSPDGRQALSGGRDKTVRLWDVASGRCLRVLEGHSGSVRSVAWSPDGRQALSGGLNGTVRLWDVASGRCLRVLEGHTDGVFSVAWSPDGRQALSGGLDGTVRLWDVASGRCLRVLEGHTDGVFSVAWSPDGRQALSGAARGVVRLWDVSTLTIYMPYKKLASSQAEIHIRGKLDSSDAVNTENAPDQVQYTNAKVLLVGDTNAGKTGLTERLAYDRPPHRGSSTSGAWATQWPLKDLPQMPGTDREVWLWDFGGQADQRLIHQLYLDHASLVLLMFDANGETVLPGLREWQQALTRSKANEAPTFLLAGRTDVGFRFDRERVRSFATESRYEYFETSSQTGIGIPELRRAMLERIPWDKLISHNSPAIFKRLKDEILRLRDEGLVLVTSKELESLLRNRLPAGVRFADAQLDTVVTLLDGPGVVRELGFGSYILLRPEWIDVYAQAVIRTLRASEAGLGSLPVRGIMEGKLVFQANVAGGKEAGEKRLNLTDERIVLQAMEEMLLERRLCLRQDGDLVFPSHCGLERLSDRSRRHSLPVTRFAVSWTISMPHSSSSWRTAGPSK